jgi:hypothetical protein
MNFDDNPAYHLTHCYNAYLLLVMFTFLASRHRLGEKVVMSGKW